MTREKRPDLFLLLKIQMTAAIDLSATEDTLNRLVQLLNHNKQQNTLLQTLA